MDCAIAFCTNLLFNWSIRVHDVMFFFVGFPLFPLPREKNVYVVSLAEINNARARFFSEFSTHYASLLFIHQFTLT